MAVPHRPASRPPVPGRSRHARARARALRDGRGPADREPARAHRSAVVRRRRAVPERLRAVHHAGPLRVPHALQPGHSRSRTSAFRAATAAPVETDARKIWRTFAAHYHLFRGTPTRIWLDHAFATVFGCNERLTPRIRRSHRSTASTRASRDAGVPPARAVRALQHRSDRDDRVAARSARSSPEDPRVRLEGPRDHRVPARSRRRSRVRRLSRQRRAVRRAHRRGHGDVDAATSRRTATRRAYFKTMGATSTDHGHPTARTCDLDARRMPAAARPRARAARPRRRKPSSSAARC